MVALVLLVISAIIGAGFATGAELVAFFGDTGLPPVVIALLIGLSLFAIMAVLVFFDTKNIRGTKHIFTAINLATFIVMSAGLRHIAGTFALVLALAFCVVVVFFGFSKMVWVNKYLMFFVLGILLFASITNLSGTSTPQSQPPRVFHGIGMAIIYAGLNCCILQRVLRQFSGTHSRRKILFACGFATVLIMVLVTLVLTAITRNGVTADMPILELSNNPITKLAVFLCILTSMMILLHNVKPSKRGGGFVCFCAALAFGFSFLGFRNILGGVYPIIGSFMILYVCYLLLHNFFIVDNSVNRLEVIGND